MFIELDLVVHFLEPQHQGREIALNSRATDLHSNSRLAGATQQDPVTTQQRQTKQNPANKKIHSLRFCVQHMLM